MLAISILRDLSPRWSAAILNHQFHGSDTHQKRVKKTSSELLQSCAPALRKMSLFLRLLIKISSTKSKYWNGGQAFCGHPSHKKVFPSAQRGEKPHLQNCWSGVTNCTAVQPCVWKPREHPQGGQGPLSLGATQTGVDHTRCEWGTIKGASGERYKVRVWRPVTGRAIACVWLSAAAPHPID